VFKHILSSNIRSLEFYAAGAKNWRKSEPKGVLALYPGYEIVKVHEPKRHFVFEIKTVDHTYRLAAHSEDELNQWILVLERESIGQYFDCLLLYSVILTILMKKRLDNLVNYCLVEQGV